MVHLKRIDDQLSKAVSINRLFILRHAAEYLSTVASQIDNEAEELDYQLRAETNAQIMKKDPVVPGVNAPTEEQKAKVQRRKRSDAGKPRKHK